MSLDKENKISRRKALKKAGYKALSASTMLILLNDPARADDPNSPDIPPDWP